MLWTSGRMLVSFADERPYAENLWATIVVAMIDGASLRRRPWLSTTQT
jgi:hypothetical protein